MLFFDFTNINAYFFKKGLFTLSRAIYPENIRIGFKQQTFYLMIIFFFFFNNVQIFIFKCGCCVWINWTKVVMCCPQTSDSQFWEVG